MPISCYAVVYKQPHYIIAIWGDPGRRPSSFTAFGRCPLTPAALCALAEKLLSECCWTVIWCGMGQGHKGHLLHVWQNLISGDCHDEDWGEFYLSGVQLSWQASSSASLWPGPTRVRDQPPVAAQLSSSWSAKSGRAAGLPIPPQLYPSQKWKVGLHFRTIKNSIFNLQL